MSISKNAQFIVKKTGEYPLSLQEVRGRHKNISFGEGASAAFYDALGYAIVQRTPRPAGDVVHEASPSKKDGQYFQEWVVREYSDEEREARLEMTKHEMLREVENLLTNYLSRGMAKEFEVGELHIQMRVDDRVNIAGLKQAAEFAIATGMADKIFTLRTWENVNVELMADDMLKLAREYMDDYTRVMSLSWTLKDAIRVATTVSELPTLPETL